MDSCCTPGGSCSGTGSFFSRWSRLYAKRFRRGGLEPVQKYLLEGIRLQPVRGSSVLDIGCGVGSLHLTLLKEGANRSVGVDMSEGMLKEAKRFAQEFGLSEKTEFIAGDFTQISSAIPESDITVLDKVVCCYENVERLVRTSTEKTGQTYAFSHPRENLLMKTLFKGHMTLARIFRWSFHPFWHKWDELQSLVLSSGFELVYENATISWQVLVFKRVRRLNVPAAERAPSQG
jgi:2-polyprenyl-3-methyl-5-hydroxy-6-metoxy-1,4-benzoquinol methylase